MQIDGQCLFGRKYVLGKPTKSKGYLSYVQLADKNRRYRKLVCMNNFK